MLEDLDRMDLRLLDGWQRDFPLEPRPFARIARREGTTEEDVLERLGRLAEAGAISRIGATCRPNTLAASTLAAMAVPEERIEEVAAIISAESGVNHSYLREDRWNIWFVATGPDRSDVVATLERIGARTGFRVLDLPLVRPFNVDLGFAFDGTSRPAPVTAPSEPVTARPGDPALMQALSEGLDLAEDPFARLGARLDRSEGQVISRIAELSSVGILSRIGVIVRHRALGWRANAMVVWAVSEPDADRVGHALARVPGVTLCYRRRIDPDFWPYPLYCMIHARTRREAMGALAEASNIDELADAPRKVLFSVRCFKQRGALIDRGRGVAA